MRIKPVHILVAILAIATLYFYQDPQSNGNSRLAVVRAVVEQGNFQIDSYVSQGNWASLDKASLNGHYYGDKAIGSWLLAVPFYFVLYRLFGLMSSVAIKHSLTAIVMGGAFVVNGVILYRIAGLITQNTWKAALAALGISLGTMMWPYSAVFYGHVPAAMFGAIAFYLVFRIRKNPETLTLRGFFWAGMAMGFAFITDYTTALIIAGLLIYAIYVLYGQAYRTILLSALAGFLGSALPLLLLVGYNLIVYRVPLAFGYSYESDPLFAQGHATGLMGIGVPNLSALYHISIDPQFGLFWQSPVLILAIIGCVSAFRLRTWRAESLLALYALASLMLMNAGFYYWWGGSSFGPRFLIVALPLMVVPLALVPDQLVWLLGSLVALSAGQMLIPLLGKIQIGLDFDAALNQFSVNAPFTGFSILYQYGIPIIVKLHSKGTLPWTLGSAIGLPYRFSAALLVAVEAALVGFLYRVTRLGRGASGPGSESSEVTENVH